MKVIQQISLFFQEGNSDKVYEVELCEVGPEGYIVNVRYGRRGGTMVTNSKTPRATSLDKATKIYDKLVQEKVKKGYLEAGAPAPERPAAPQEMPDFAYNADTALLRRLQDGVEGGKTFRTNWKLSRVMWTAGERKLQEAVPLVIQILNKLLAENKPIYVLTRKEATTLTKEQAEFSAQLYSGLWMLARCGDTQAVEVFQKVLEIQGVPRYIRRLAAEGAFRCAPANIQQQGYQQILENLEADFREPIQAQNPERLRTKLQERLEEKQTKYHFIEQVYALAPAYPWISKVFAEVIQALPLRPPYWRHLRALFKTAELRDDHRILGVLHYHIEKTPALFTKTNYWHHQWIGSLGRSFEVDEELARENSELAFSLQTKTYFQRRAARQLSTLGKHDGKGYVQLATAILLQYQPEDERQATYYRPGGFYPKYNKDDGKYYHTMAFRPEHYQCHLLHHILSGNNPHLKAPSGTMLQWSLVEERKQQAERRWDYQYNLLTKVEQAQLGAVKFDRVSERAQWLLEEPQRYKAGLTLHTLSEAPEAFAQHWQQMPEAFVQLLLQSKMSAVVDFAYRNFKKHPAYPDLVQRLNAPMVYQLLQSPVALAAWFGWELVRARQTLQTQLDTVFALLLSRHSFAQEAGVTLLEQNAAALVQDTEGLWRLLYGSPIKHLPRVLALVKTQPLQSAQTEVLWGKLISGVLQQDQQLDLERVQLLLELLREVAPEKIAQISWDTLIDLIQLSSNAAKILVGTVLVGKLASFQIHEIPFSLIETLLDSTEEGVLANGQALLEAYPLADNEALWPRLWPLLEHEVLSLRQSVQTTCQRLVAQSEVFGLKLREQVLKLLLRKEAVEGLHEELCQFLQEGPPQLLSGISRKQVLNLIYGHYRTPQLLGTFLLKTYLEANDLTIRQIVALGNHELKELRDWVIAYYHNNPARIRYEREEALRLLDAKWDDTREAATAFFSTVFGEEDWDLDCLISIADSVRPDIEALGQSLISRYFKEEDGATYLLKLSQHPSVRMQLFASNYLERYASGHWERIQSLDFYFRSVLTRVNKGRVAKTRVLAFLHKEALQSAKVAQWVAQLFNELVVTNAVEDKARFIGLLYELQQMYPELEVALKPTDVA
ncbi:WGR domain-containing protein [Eisenibacter elegans]|uniref:WGR domain-containing protein n=1 Tax=Eisenibacter elegans TaxID=997 RepID=UPI0004138738|nr:WGR domain-containing protein [Eisenibacter elegans]